MTDFDKSIAFVLSWEGGYSNDPDDPGGETNFGICKRSFPGEDIKNMTKERAIEIYKSNYWDSSGCNLMDWPMNLIMLDTAVNMGIGTAQKLREDALDWRDFIIKRINKYNLIAAKGSNVKFLRGWLNRVLSLYERINKEVKV